MPNKNSTKSLIKSLANDLNHVICEENKSWDSPEANHIIDRINGLSDILKNHT